MKIKRFIGEMIHAELNFNISFNEDLTFLAGINGSGKTTVLNCIAALITPSLDILANINYELIRIEFTHDGQEGMVEATRVENSVFLKSSNAPVGLSFLKFALD